VCCDGTWGDGTSKDSNTHVAKIASSFNDQDDRNPFLTYNQVVYYQPGIGTGGMKHVSAITGMGKLYSATYNKYLTLSQVYHATFAERIALFV
jgi:uncharacterized protein (DUF2235 family)